MQTLEIIWQAFVNDLVLDLFTLVAVMIPILGIWIYKRYYKEKK